MSSKKQVKNVPCDFCLWLARYVNHFNKGHKKENRHKRINERLHKKGQTTFGFSFNKTALRMKELGYKPKVQSYASSGLGSTIGVGDRNVNLPLKPYSYKDKMKSHNLG
jgi:hypothetical protein